MSLVALASAKASPGVTTAAVLLTAVWRDEQPLLVEADPDGGVLAARYGLATHPGLVSAAAAARRGIDADEIGEHVQEIPGQIRVMTGPTSADQAHAALTLAGPLVSALATLTAPVVVDCGRLRPGSPALPLAVAADLVVLITRPEIDEVHHLLHRVHALGETRRPTGLVTVGHKPYAPEEVAAAVGLPLIGVLAEDAPAANALREGRGSHRALRRSTLARSAVEVAEGISAVLAGEQPETHSVEAVIGAAE